MRGKRPGQLMIIVAVGMVVFLGVAALAIDLGRGYSEKRNAQNAADAAALAGMKMVRTPTSATMNGSDIYNAMLSVARLNGGTGLILDPNSAVFIDSNKVPLTPNPTVNAWTSTDFSSVYGIRVKADIPYRALFGGVLGTTDMSSSAVATAMSYQVNPARSLLPIAFHTQGTCSDFGFHDSTTEYTFIDDTSAGGSQIGWISFDGTGNANNLADWVNGTLPANFMFFDNYQWDGMGGAPDPGVSTSACDDGFYHNSQNGGMDWTYTTKTEAHPTVVQDPAHCNANGDSNWWDGGCDLKDSVSMQSSPTTQMPPTIKWFRGNSGVSGNADIQAAWPKLLNQSVTVLIYNKQDNAGTGQQVYQVVGWAGFTVTGVAISPHIMIKGTFNSAVTWSPATPTPTTGGMSTVRLVPN